MCVTLVGLAEAQRHAPGLPQGAKLYVAPMEWDLDRYLTAEIRKQALPVNLVTRPEVADFVMTSLYQGMGSHMMTAGHYIQVKIAAVDTGDPVWGADANDYALLFGRLRSHGPGRVAVTIVKKLRIRMSGNQR